MHAPRPNPDHGGESGAERSSDPQGSSDERVLLDQIQPVAPAGMLLFLGFAVFNAVDPWMRFSPLARAILVSHDLCVVALCAWIYLRLRRGRLSASLAHPLLATLDAVVVSNVLTALAFSGDLFYSHYIAVVTIVASAIALSRRWMGAMVLGNLVAWLCVASAFAARRELVHFGFLLLASAAVAVAIHAGRATGRRRLRLEIAHRVEIERQLVAANARLQEQNRRDELTGLLNRSGVFERLAIELARHDRGHPLAVLVLDIDSFKAVNDTHGHLQGDRLLRAFAELLQRGTRASDALGRYGGDEFVVLLADTERAEAETIAVRLVGQIQRSGQALFADTPTSASCGVALARPGEDSTAVLERADAAAYLVKSKGGNGVAVAA